MAIYYDNIIFSLQRAGGISVVWQNLLSEIQKINDDCYAIEYKGCEKNIFRQQLDFRPDKILHCKIRISKIIEQLVSVRLNNVTKPFVFHSSYYRICNNMMAQNVTTVHDFIYENIFSKKSISEQIRLWQNYKAIRQSKKVVCISENTKKDLLKYLPDINESDICVIYNGVSNDYKILDSRFTIYNDYILFVGGRQSYKNFEFAARVVKHTKFKLLVCGNELTATEKQLLEEILGPDRYLCKLRPSNLELNQIYNSAYCLFYPSSYEGFGIPILEAQRAGCPVIALNSSSIPEVIGNGGLLLNKLDIGEAVSLINEIENIRTVLITEGINNSMKFSWEKMAKEYNRLYNDLLK